MQLKTHVMTANMFHSEAPAAVLDITWIIQMLVSVLSCINAVHKQYALGISKFCLNTSSMLVELQDGFQTQTQIMSMNVKIQSPLSAATFFFLFLLFLFPDNLPCCKFSQLIGLARFLQKSIYIYAQIYIHIYICNFIWISIQIKSFRWSNNW